MPNPQPKADEKKPWGRKDGNKLPFETAPVVTAVAPKGGMASLGRVVPVQLGR